MNLLNKLNSIKITKNLIVVLKISFIIILLGLLGFYLYSSYSQKFDIFPANVGSQSFSVAWTSEIPSRGCVVAIPQNNLKNTKIVCQKEAKSLVHILNFKQVIPDTIYKVFYINGLHVNLPNINSVITPPIPETQPPLPNPAYGSVINTFGGKARNTLVLLTAQTPNFQYPLATITNNSGNYSFDLNGFNEAPNSYRLEVISDGEIWNDKYISSKVVSPIPQITTTQYVQ